MKTKTKSKKIQLTNEDRNRQLERRATSALFEKIKSAWEQAKESATSAAKLEISAANKMRDCGTFVQEASGHDQVNFDWWHMHQEQLPKDMTFKALKACVHLARSFEEPIKTLDEMRSARQLMFEAFGQASEPHRLNEQNSHDRNPWNDFVNGAATFLSLFDKLEDVGMEQWSKEKLKKFALSTDPIAERNHKAHELLGR